MNLFQTSLVALQLTLFITFMYCAAKAMVMIITEYKHNENMHK
jgi:hypothetical protein